MSGPGAQIETLRDHIEASDVISDADRSALFDFSDELYLLQTKYSDHRHLKLLRHCTRMAEHVGGLAEALEDRDATEDIVRWINRTYDNEETNRDYRVALSVFGRRTSDENGDDPPESIEWVPSGTSSSYDPEPNPGDMLHWEEDVLPMIEATRYSRDAALIAAAWDSGARSGEIRGLSVGDVTDHRHGFQLTFQGKTGQRTVTLIPSVPYLQQWLSDHPARDDPNAPMDCPRCGKETPREKDFCVWCGQATSHDDIEKAQEAMTVFENRPDLLEDAERFREALGDS